MVVLDTLCLDDCELPETAKIKVLKLLAAMDVDVKGAAFEGLLEKAASEAAARIPQPAGRKTIAQRFNAGFPGGRGTSPVRDERNRWHCIADSFAPSGLMGF